MKASSKKLILSQTVRAKLAAKDPPVSESEIEQCFANRVGKLLIDTRAKNGTNPYTRWFIAETDFGRKLKVCFIPLESGTVVKTAYDPNVREISIYTRYGESS